MSFSPRSQNAKSLQHQLILRNRGGGVANTVTAEREGNDETKRRYESEAAALAPAPARNTTTVVGGSPQPAPVQPIPPATPDRLHKDAPSYVVVSHDHVAADNDPVPNPGYAVVGHASSIADGYARALYHTLNQPKGSPGRVVLQIWGGTWNEPLNVVNPGIDVIGVGRPLIVGNSTINGPTNQVLLEGLEFQSPNTNEALAIGQGIDIVWTAESQIRIIDCDIHGPAAAFVTDRRVFMDRVHGWQDTQVDTSLEIATMTFRADLQDTWWSLCRNCTFETFRLRGALQNSYKGYPVKATSKIFPPAGVGGGYLIGPMPYNNGPAPGVNNFVLRNSGLQLDDCYIYGTGICEGWNVMVQHGAHYGGQVAAPDAAGESAWMIRGWALTDGSSNRVHAQVFVDNSVYHAPMLATFVADPNNTAPVWGGYFGFLNSTHLCKLTGAPLSPFYNNNSTGFIGIVNSATACTSWPATGVVPIAVTNSPTSIDTYVMLDPITLQ